MSMLFGLRAHLFGYHYKPFKAYLSVNLISLSVLVLNEIKVLILNVRKRHNRKFQISLRRGKERDVAHRNDAVRNTVGYAD